MKRSKLFISILFATALLLLLVDLPFPLNFGKINMSFSKKPANLSFDFSKINLNLGLLTLQKSFDYRLGLDLQGGASLVYRVEMKNIPKQDRDTAFESARSVIERRINFFGVTEPTIQSLKLPNEYRVIVDLPGTSNVNQALDLIGRTAQLTFWEEGNQPMASSEAALYPYGLSLFFKNRPVETDLTGKDLKGASVVFGQTNGAPQIQLMFTPKGSKLFADITSRNVGRKVAIVLDNAVLEAPVVQQAIIGGNAVITGSFTTQSAKDLAIQLNAGALPAPLTVIGQSTVPPSLGMASLKRSFIGGILGFLGVVIFMIFLYKKEGLLACVALVMYTIFVLFTFKAIPVTLTLAGIAGFILSVGMAVDANILIFERTKEELRAGKPKDLSIRLGFSRAWPSIRDSNISSLITTFILFEFGSGPVRGFALTLAIGILVSMFSAIVITRNMLAVFDKN